MRKSRDKEINPADSAQRGVESVKELFMKPDNILEAFEGIVELAYSSSLNVEFFIKAEPFIKYARRKLKLTAMQTVLLAIFVDRSEDHSIRLSEIANYVGCRTTRMLRLTDEIDVLEAKRYLRVSRSKDMVSYRVPNEVLEALRKNKAYVHIEKKLADTSEFFDRFNKLMEEKRNQELTHEQLIDTTKDMLADIKDTKFAKCIRRYVMDSDEILLLVFMAHLFVENDDDRITFGDIENIFDDSEIPGWIKSRFRYRRLELFEQKLIENANEDGMARSDAFKLTDQAKEELLSELNIETTSSNTNGLIKAETLAAKEMVYNDEEEWLVTELESILEPTRFDEIQRRLAAMGMRKGFCCLFYGAPGTGKTETVNQLARTTGRDILRVDVEKIKSCWVGESEKNVKKLFDQYRTLCRNSELTPILLFNEADAVLGVRMEGASRAVDKMENSIQNIILQEMESLEGIMIATTNLTDNLDKAFERRFLYKIKFEKPTEEARAQIWQAMIDDLEEDDAQTLARMFDLSGGEIENIARKHSINRILSGSDSFDIDDLTGMCLNERINSQPGHRRIGYRP